MNKDTSPESILALQEELQTSKQILKAIFDSTQSSIFFIAPDYQIIFFNKWARDGSKLLYGRDMVIGDNLLNYRSVGDEAIYESFKTNFEHAIATRTPVISEQEMRYPQMSFWVRSEYTPVYPEDGKLIGVLLHVQDITARKRFEIENQEKQAQLNLIAWSQSHETRQPVATLLGLVNILEKESMSNENQKVIKLLEETALKLERVIRQNVIRANIHL